MRWFCICVFYAAAFFFIWGAFQMAPDMTWPHTNRDWVAVNLLMIGCASKLLGHAMLLFAES